MLGALASFPCARCRRRKPWGPPGRAPRRFTPARLPATLAGSAELAASTRALFRRFEDRGFVVALWTRCARGILHRRGTPSCWRRSRLENPAFVAYLWAWCSRGLLRARRSEAVAALGRVPRPDPPGVLAFTAHAWARCAAGLLHEGRRGFASLRLRAHIHRCWGRFAHHLRRIAQRWAVCLALVEFFAAASWTHLPLRPWTAVALLTLCGQRALLPAAVLTASRRRSALLRERFWTE